VPFFTPSGVLSTAIDELTSEIVVASGLDTDLVESVSAPDFYLGVNVAWIVHDGVEEFVPFQNVVQGESGITLQVVARGCLDTAPTAFPAGTRVWFISYGSQIVNIRGPVPPTINVYNDIRFQAFNNQSEFPFTSCPTSQVVATTPARSAKIYCPTDVRFNGESYPASITGELTVSWSHRNRLGTWSYVGSTMWSGRQRARRSSRRRCSHAGRCRASRWSMDSSNGCAGCRPSSRCCPAARSPRQRPTHWSARRD
jgi:hypothetical protein